ncbi:hypothetical protein K466DRAFT_439612, partial [Polyporus arcularius HHB13444]
LDIHALARVRATCSDGDQYVSATLCRRMRMLISPYFTRYWDFVEEMQITGAVIGGEAALSVLHPQLQHPSTLTIFLPNRLFFHMLAYLCAVEGYSAVLATRRGDRDAVQRRTCTAALTRGTRGIELIQSTTHSALYALLGQWNTALPAYITPTRFCDPYPLLTRARRALVDTRHTMCSGLALKPHLRPLVAEWRKRGWSVAIHPTVWDPRRVRCEQNLHPDCALAVRYFGDKHCVAGPLLPVQRPSMQLRRRAKENSVEEYTVIWWRGGRLC